MNLGIWWMIWRVRVIVEDENLENVDGVGEQRFERESEKSGKILSVMKMMKWWLYRVWMLTKLDSVKFLQVQIGWRL